ncbi:hypothetical protein ADL00_30560 [Streptomyces sp. AS58]|uniref:hypothetical protein n=1 Tax=Streptomyces sp. AS58 TaxID=1519489 RepID=UPI0006AE3196|nr:hypothetical protein [Streptomyces sp. AS58]KOV54472.1 hypothetical protein ADL00_30560 [Streptomyces sp. AS58]
MVFPESRGGLWTRAVVTAVLYLAALFWLALSLPFVGEEIGPTSDPDDVFGANFILLFSALFLLGAAVVSRRWKAAWVVSLTFLVVLVIVWTQVPSLIEHWDHEGPRRF